MKLTEDKVVLLLKVHLENSGWNVDDKFCLGQKQGIDIEACKDGQTLLIEVKEQGRVTQLQLKRETFLTADKSKLTLGKLL